MAARKKILTCVLGALGLVAIGITGVSVYIGSSAKATVTRLIEANNVTGAKDAKMRWNISYQAMETQYGFLQATVRLVQPVIAVEMALAPMPALGTHASAMPAAPVSLKSKSSYDGSIDITTDFLAHQYTITVDGARTDEISGAMNLVAVAPSADAKFTLRAKTAADFLAWQSFPKGYENDPNKFLKQVAEVSLVMAPFTMTDKATNAMLMQAGDGEIRLVNRSEGTRRDMDVTFSAKATEIAPAFAALFNGMLVAMDPSQAQLMKAGLQPDQMPFSMARLGKQDIVLRASIEANKDVGAHKQCPDMTIRVDELLLRNNLYDISGPFALSMIPENADCVINYKQQLTTTYKPAIAQETALVVDMFQATRSQLGGLAGRLAAEKGTTTADPALLKAKIMAALPNVSTLGPIRWDADVKGRFPLAATTPGQNDSIQIERLNLNHNRWGIELKGAADKTSGVVNGTFICRKCDFLTYDLMMTAMQINEIARLNGAAGTATPLGGPMLADINLALAEVGAKNAATGDITFEIAMPTKGDLRINGKPGQQAIMAAMQRLQPYFTAGRQVQAQPAQTQGKKPPRKRLPK